MRLPNLTVIIALSGLVAAGFGCGKKEEPKSDLQKSIESGATAVKQEADKAAAAAAETAKRAADAVKETADKAAAAAKEQPAATTPAASEASAKAQSIIDAAKKLVADGNWQEASKKLESLTGLKLTAEQQSFLDQLKQQIKQLQAGSDKLKGDANKAVGDLLKK